MHCSSLGSTGGNFIKNFSPSSSSPCASNHHAFAKHLEGGQLSKRDLNYVRKFTRGFSSVQLDGVPVSVSEWLFGFFVLILFGVDEYFSCINYHTSKDMYWARTGHLKAWVILALLYFLILLRSIENHSSGLKANLGGKLPTIVVARFPSLFSCYNNIKNKPNKVALTYCWYVQWFGKQKYLLNDWLTKSLKFRYQYCGIQSNNLEWRHVCFKIRILMENIHNLCACTTITFS